MNINVNLQRSLFRPLWERIVNCDVQLNVLMACASRLENPHDCNINTARMMSERIVRILFKIFLTECGIVEF